MEQNADSAKDTLKFQRSDMDAFKILQSTLNTWKSLPLDIKIEMSLDRIKSWYESFDGKVYVSFSGGKDSTVLLHLVRSVFPDVEGVFVNTGMEYPEIVNFVKTKRNIRIVRPKMLFKNVIEKYGFPVVSKEVSEKIHNIRNSTEHIKNTRINGDSKGNGKLAYKWRFLINSDFKISDKCCDKLKKEPIHTYESQSKKVPYVGTMAVDSRLREVSLLLHGCNQFDSSRPRSTPIGFWTEKDIWNYIKIHNLEYSKIYDMGYSRTGCMFCMFGVNLEKSQKNRFQRMKITHPVQYNFCINKLGLGKILEVLKVPYGKEGELTQSYFIKD